MLSNKLSVLIDTSPLGDANAHRGVGMYTRMLLQHLADLPQVEVMRSLADTQSKPDIVHYPYFDFFFSTLPLRHPAKAVVTIHDVIPLKFPDHYPAGIKGSLRFQKQKLALKGVSAIITDSEASKQDIIGELGISPDKVHVVYLAGNPELQKASETQIKQVRQQYGLKKPYLLYVGDINYNKNIPQLIKMLKFVPEEVELVLVGRNFVAQDIPEWQWIETQMALSDVADRVQFVSDLGSDAHETLSALYSGAEAYVQPSLYEGFGLPVLEAMQCRTPVVSSNTSSLPEVAGEHAILCPPTAEDLADGVNQVLEWSKTKRQQQLRQAYAWSQEFSWQKTAAATYQVYQQL